MKVILILAVTSLTLFANTVMADEFGERFYSHTPVGLGDYTASESEISDIAMDEIAKDLQLIMPASGEDSEVETENIITQEKNDEQQ